MSIRMEEFLKRYKNGNLNLIDIRDKYKYEYSHIEGAINIPSNYLITNPENYLDKAKRYYLYCYNGHISNDVSNELNYLGYNTVSILGGYNYYLLIK